MVGATRRWRRALAGLALAALAAAAALAPAWRVDVAVRRRSERVAAGAAAAALADYSTLGAGGAWRVLHEAAAGGAWRYSVAFECGPRCAGEAHVEADERAGEHAVRLRSRSCRWASAPPWPRVCEWTELEWRVSASGGGSAVAGRGRAWCGAARALGGACARDLRALMLRQLGAALP